MEIWIDMATRMFKKKDKYKQLSLDSWVQQHVNMGADGAENRNDNSGGENLIRPQGGVRKTLPPDTRYSGGHD